MKAIYIKPEIENMTLRLKQSINDDTWGVYGVNGQSPNVGAANEGDFFAEEDYDDEYDPFFDE